MKPINDIYIDIIKDIWYNGIEVSPRGKKVKEILGYKVVCDPKDNIITLPGLKTNTNYASKELEWYESGTNKIDFDPLINKIWLKFSDDGKTVNSAYGYYIFNKDYATSQGLKDSQWNLVKEKLKSDNDSRQAIININNTHHKSNYETKDFPCTIYCQVFIRNNKLYWITNMRSNDIYYGFRNDLYTFTELQKRLAKELGIECGEYIHIAGSMHLYESEFEKVKEYL